jgi:hypothetical protein
MSPTFIVRCRCTIPEGRDPERSDSEIARAIRTSVPAVVKARERLRAG